MELPGKLLESQIKRGCIIYYKFDDIDHSKYCVIIGESDSNFIGFFFINTNINFRVNSKPVLMNLQYLLKKEDYSFLKYDSFLSCTEIKPISKNILLTSLTSNKSELKGNLIKDHLNEILILVRDSKVFSKLEKETYFK